MDFAAIGKIHNCELCEITIKMPITDSGWKSFASTKPQGRSKRNTLFQMRRKVVFQRYAGTKEGDELGGHPYKDYEDYLTGLDGTGVWADIDTPHPDDVLLAAQHGEVLTHSILVRYDSRIDPRMIIKYTNLQTGKERFWWIRSAILVDFEYHYLRIGAEELVDFPPQDE